MCIRDSRKHQPNYDGAERPSGKFHANAYHDDKRTNDGHQGGEELGDAFLQRVGHAFCIVGNAAQDVAASMGIVIGHRQTPQFSSRFPSEFQGKVLGYACHHELFDERKYCAQNIQYDKFHQYRTHGFKAYLERRLGFDGATDPIEYFVNSYAQGDWEEYAACGRACETEGDCCLLYTSSRSPCKSP